MQKLLEFLIGKRHWFVFLLCEVLSFTLLYRYNAYQRNVMLSSANVVSGSILSVSNAVFSYVNLKEENRQLLTQNEQLEGEVLRLKLQLEAMKANMFVYDGIMTDSVDNSYEYLSAQVVNNSVTYLLNYITINKGSRDGIKPEMAVVSNRGVVGKVIFVNERFSTVISLLNPKWKLSCKLLNRDFSGFLVWNGRDAQYADLEELPTYTEYQVGDTVVTTGYSAAFPAGVVVGTVVESDKYSSSGGSSLKVKLSTDFSRLTTVGVIKNNYQEEQWAVEQEARKND